VDALAEKEEKKKEAEEAKDVEGQEEEDEKTEEANEEESLPIEVPARGKQGTKFPGIGTRKSQRNRKGGA